VLRTEVRYRAGQTVEDIPAKILFAAGDPLIVFQDLFPPPYPGGATVDRQIISTTDGHRAPVREKRRNVDTPNGKVLELDGTEDDPNPPGAKLAHALRIYSAASSVAAETRPGWHPRAQGSREISMVRNVAASWQRHEIVTVIKTRCLNDSVLVLCPRESR